PVRLCAFNQLTMPLPAPKAAFALKAPRLRKPQRALVQSVAGSGAGVRLLLRLDTPARSNSLRRLRLSGGRSMKRMLMRLAATLAAAALAHPAAAEVIDKTGVFNGVKVQYRVITPPGYSPAKTYPVLLVFTGGSQEWAGVQRTLDDDWKDEAAKRGYI